MLVEVGVAPIAPVQRMMETAHRMERGACSTWRIIRCDLIAPPACGDDGRELLKEHVGVTAHHRGRLLQELDVGIEQVRVVQCELAFRRAERIEPATHSVASRTPAFGDHAQRRDHLLEPTLSDRLHQRGLGREVAKHAAMAHPQRAGDIEHRRLGWSKYCLSSSTA
jgi:hypothetical protein